METKILRPLKAIRAKCLDCCGGSFTEVKLCEISDCPLFPYRFGKRPIRARREVATRSGSVKKTQFSNYSGEEKGQSMGNL